MNTPNKKPPGRTAIPQLLNRPAGHEMHFKPVVAQLKTPVSAQSAKRPVAPPVYRPQAVPKAMQLKTSNRIANSKLPVAPPVYRPSPRPVQFPRGVGGSRGVQLAEKHPMAPPFPPSSSSSSSRQGRDKKISARIRERSLSPQRDRAESETPGYDRSRSRSRGHRSHSVPDDDNQYKFGVGKRERRPSAKLIESGVDRERRSSVVEKAAERKQSLNEFGSAPEKKLEGRRGQKAIPPAGVFLMFGERGELGWAVTEATQGRKGDEHIYHLARSGQKVNKDKDSLHLPDHKFQNGRDEYRCARCKQYFPLQSQQRPSDAGHITVDHVPPMSKRLDGRECLATVCDGTNVWEGQHKGRCIASFNEPTRLQMMCDSDNSSKGGLKQYVRSVPELLGTHDDLCSLDSHSDVREIG